MDPRWLGEMRLTGFVGGIQHQREVHARAGIHFVAAWRCGRSGTYGRGHIVLGVIVARAVHREHTPPRVRRPRRSDRCRG